MCARIFSLVERVLGNCQGQAKSDDVEAFEKFCAACGFPESTIGWPSKYNKWHPLQLLMQNASGLVHAYDRKHPAATPSNRTTPQVEHFEHVLASRVVVNLPQVQDRDEYQDICHVSIPYSGPKHEFSPSVFEATAYVPGDTKAKEL